MRGERVAVSVHPADTVSIPICDQAKVCRIIFKGCSAVTVIFIDWFRTYAAKIWIMISVKSSYFAVRVFKDLIETTCSHTKKCLMGKIEFRFGYHFKINESF